MGNLAEQKQEQACVLLPPLNFALEKNKKAYCYLSQSYKTLFYDYDAINTESVRYGCQNVGEGH